VSNEAAGRRLSMRAVGRFVRTGTCSETLFGVLNRAYGHPMRDEERASGPLAGGLMMHGYQCGQAWGAALAAGAQACRLFGAGPHAQTKAVVAAQRATSAFRAQNKYIDCSDITQMDEKSSKMRAMSRFFLRGGPIICLRMAGRYAPLAFNEINASLSQDGINVPPAPVSCAALLAQRMGAPECHAVMAAGLAGGIGLSGGACGALGAAIWLTGMNSLQEGAAKLTFKNPNALVLIDRFLKCTNYEFECSSIVGRTFESVADHASHVCQGGCAKILDTLAAG
jgi:hypothetical protein